MGKGSIFGEMLNVENTLEPVEERWSTEGKFCNGPRMKE